MAAGVDVKMTPSHPGDFVRTEIIEALGLSVTKAAEVLGVRRATLSALLHAKAALSPEMALRIEKAFGVSMDMLMRMQAWHDTAQMRARAHEIKVQRYAATPAQPPAPLCGFLDAIGPRFDLDGHPNHPQSSIEHSADPHGIGEYVKGLDAHQPRSDIDHKTR